MTTETLSRAGEIWEYLSAFKAPDYSDAIVICCSYDLRVCDHACELILQGLADTLVISGGSGNWTRHLWDKPEAEVYFARALENGVPAAQILIEPMASNFGENITYSRVLIPKAKTVTFVTKPNSLLRAKLTASAQWPEVNALVSCPDIRFPGEISNVIGVWGVINEMVGDIERIQIYSALGFQAHHELPDGLIRNWKYLIEQGFTAHLMAPSKPTSPD